MKKYIFILFFLNQYHIYCQKKIQPKDTNNIIVFFNSYNSNNYKLMRKNLFFIGRVVLNESKLRSSFSEIKNAYGNFKILNIKSKGQKNYVVSVSSKRDSTETENFALKLNKFHKIKSFTISAKNYSYKKQLICKRSSIKQLRIDSLLNYKCRYGGFNGSIAVIDNNGLYYKKTIGYSNYYDKTSLNDSSVYYLASCSKQFTAMCILMLMERDKLKLNDTLQKYFPNFPYKNITIENLLTHTSGLPDYLSLMENDKRTSMNFTNIDVLNFLIDTKPKCYFKPSSQFDYSNTGYVLLALIIEKCSGLSYSDFVRQNIFMPLNMKKSTVNGSSFDTGSKIKNWAFGYSFSDSLGRYIVSDSLSNNKYVKYFDLVNGDGNVNCSIDDFIKWEIALRNSTLIEKSNTDKMFSSFVINKNEKINYGYGQCIEESDSFQKQVFHSGGWAGYSTLVFRLIESNLTVIILSNNEYPSFNQLNNHLCKIILEDDSK